MIHSPLSLANTRALYDQFVSFSSESINTLTDALAAGDMLAVALASCRLKGACYQVGAHSAETSCVLLRLAAYHGSDIVVRKAFQTLLVELDLFEQQLLMVALDNSRARRVRRALESSW